MRQIIKFFRWVVVRVFGSSVSSCIFGVEYGNEYK